jgi:hypothetical protein
MAVGAARGRRDRAIGAAASHPARTDLQGVRCLPAFRARLGPEVHRQLADPAPIEAISIAQQFPQRFWRKDADTTVRKCQVTFCFKPAQNGASRSSGYICHMCEFFVGHIDFNRRRSRWIGDAAIPKTEQDGHKSLDVIAYHQVVGPSEGKIEMANHCQAKESPFGRIFPDDFVNSS